MAVGKVVLLAAVASLLVVPVLAGSNGRASSPSRFQLDMKDGFHGAATGDKFYLGFRHEGPFTASAPFCTAGYAVDVLLVPPIEDRQFTCSDGSGTITARKTVTRTNAEFTQEQGTWTIVGGTGRYVELRGKGTSVLDTTSGNPADHITTRFTETWAGVVDYDVTRPVVSVSKTTVRRLRSPARTYNVRVTLAARDGSTGNPVSYSVTVSGGGAFAGRSGTTTSGSAIFNVRVRLTKQARALRLTVVASDPVGNEVKLVRQLKLKN